jgi:hypothetical protein
MRRERVRVEPTGLVVHLDRHELGIGSHRTTTA